MSTKTITIDTNEWLYPSVNGITHTVTNGQTFTFEMTDGGASAVTYQTDGNQSVTTTDGRRIHFLADAENATNGTSNGNARRTWGPTADAEDATTLYSKIGSLLCLDPETHIVQRWRTDTILVDNVDAPTAITAKFTDQFGNSFTWTTVTVS